jgi:hypothetical protein
MHQAMHPTTIGTDRGGCQATLLGGLRPHVVAPPSRLPSHPQTGSRRPLRGPHPPPTTGPPTDSNAQTAAAESETQSAAKLRVQFQQFTKWQCGKARNRLTRFRLLAVLVTSFVRPSVPPLRGGQGSANRRTRTTKNWNPLNPVPDLPHPTSRIRNAQRGEMGPLAVGSNPTGPTDLDGDEGPTLTAGVLPGGNTYWRNRPGRGAAGEGLHGIRPSAPLHQWSSRGLQWTVRIAQGRRTGREANCACSRRRCR